jgi:redox-regulated HSP33 family molecular chaperone
MHRLIASVLAAAVVLGAGLPAVPARAAGQYPIKIETKGEPASITAYAPADQAIRMTVYLPANTTKSYALENADHYEFRLTICGKTHTARWNRGGGGVIVSINGCSGYSFTMQR